MVRSLGGRLGALFGRGGRPIEQEPGLRERCLACEEPLVASTLYIEHRVCPACRFHYSLTARERISLLADPATFRETRRSITSLAPLSFNARVSSRKRAGDERLETGLTEAAITGRCSIAGRPVVLIVLDFRFLGGGMGGVVGEKVSLAFEMATRRKLAVVAAVTSGGARVHEGVLSLMQMPKTSFAVNALRQEGLPFITVMANPTTGQVYSGFANLADVILAEPGALLGFAALRLLAESPGGSLPDEVPTAESLLEHGMIDRVVDREHLRDLLSVLLDLFTPQAPPPRRRRAKQDEPAEPEERVAARIEREQLVELWPSSWETVPLVRHSQRPTSLDFIRRTLSNFVELHGDRHYGDDPSIVAGLGYLGNRTVAVVGQERGHDLTSRERRAGRTLPEGFRKAQRMMELASRLQIPLITLVDTPGPSYDRASEERGQGGAIASTMALMAQLSTPTVSVVIGEAGSEGALALGVADRNLMLENATYSAVSPESLPPAPAGTNPRTPESKASVTLTAQECLELGVIDLIVSEPKGGANRNPDEAALRLKKVLEEEITALSARSPKRFLRDRYRKFRNIGEFSSHVRAAVGREVAYLQGYVTQGVRLIRRRRPKREALPPGKDEGE